ncbi:hypothetical protein [Reticulibacter mediterranei]|nr:hypothetical protein [Reticulibacter mediterranei]
MSRKQTSRARKLPIVIEQLHPQSDHRRRILAQPAHPSPLDH